MSRKSSFTKRGKLTLIGNGTKWGSLHNYMKAFLEQKEREGVQQNVYYYCIRDYFFAKYLNKDDNDVKSMLVLIYSERLIKEVMSDLMIRNNVLNNLPLPNCFNCDICKVKSNCHFNKILGIEKVLQEKQIQNGCSQNRLFEIFDA